jgi:high-affinity iron transporter
VLATLVIGLREGLEAALIVSIIAAFLRNNGKSLVPMWLGVIAAVLLSIAVGVGLDLVEKALPQAAQEGLETLIGIVAVIFVTGMIIWMNNHARDIKRQLESEAAHALGRASTWALASMAFLAVLKEGFETSVFLLATFSAAQSASLAVAGAVLGILLAIVIGWAIYVGGVKFNLGKFFRYTAAFLVLVAAGLVVSSLHTAHEAGWLNAGQQPLMNLGWLVAPGSVQSALITGVLGIPATPRLVEVLGWLAYLIPMALYLYWPQEYRPGSRGAAWLKIGIAAVSVMVAVGLVAGYPQPMLSVPASAPLSVAGHATSMVGTVTLTPPSDKAPANLTVRPEHSAPYAVLLADPAQQRQRDGLTTSFWQPTRTTRPSNMPASLSLQELITLAGGRIPIGLNPRQNPGPFQANWQTHQTFHVWSVDGVLLDAKVGTILTVTLTGGGISTPRTLTINAVPSSDSLASWQVSSTYVESTASALRAVEAATSERYFWATQLPLLLTTIALILIALAWRSLTRQTALGAMNASLTLGNKDQTNPTKTQSAKTEGAQHVA